MKRLFTLLTFLPFCAAAQPPAGYYNSAANLNGQPLRVALYNIIKTATQLSYTPGLWNAYYTTDVKPNGKLWDIYSDVPGGTPAYQYTLGSDQCGNGANHENSCYNREHLWPQSLFGSAYPMVSDLWVVYPTDYYVNNQRGNLPYGKVGTATKTFTNGSKLGNNVYPNAPTSVNCFEPIDSFKGDIARSYFYIVTRYYADSNYFTTWEMANKIALKPWAVQMLLDWHHLDPVSQKEIDRNNAAYALQNNRNPYIDNPMYADCIWGTANCNSLSVLAVNKLGQLVVFPNPAENHVSIASEDLKEGTLDVLDATGKNVYHSTAAHEQRVEIATEGWAKGVYIIRLQSEKNLQVTRLIVR